MPPQPVQNPRRPWHRATELTANNALALLHWVMPQLAAEPMEPRDGTGVVMAAGGKYLRYAYASLNRLRDLDPHIRIQVWLLKGELPDRRFDPLRVEWRECEPFFTHEGSMLRTGWAAKALAVRHCGFRHVLLLDADSAPVMSPEELFASEAYRATGLVLWPDVANHTHGEFWASVGLKFGCVPEHEAGQVLIDAERQADVLKLCMWLNCHEYFHSSAFGDKNLWGIAAMKLKKPFVTADSAVWRGWGIEHFLSGESAFLHVLANKREGWHPETPPDIAELWNEYDRLLTHQLQPA
jgi:hypothetical protein